MRIKLIATVSGCLLALGSGSALAQATAPAAREAVAQRASAVRDRFIAAVVRCGGRPAYIPGVVADTPPDAIHFDPGDHAVHVGLWEKLPPPLQDFMRSWATQGTLGLSPEGMWGEIFNDLLVAHELGHYLQITSGAYEKLDFWQSEIDANRIALAFWEAETRDPALLAQREANFTRYLLALPSPVPAGEDPRAYFAAHYAELGQSAEAYGWYQGLFMQTAWAQRRERGFCDWVKLNPPLQTAPATR